MKGKGAKDRAEGPGEEGGISASYYIPGYTHAPLTYNKRTGIRAAAAGDQFFSHGLACMYILGCLCAYGRIFELCVHACS